MRGKDPEHEVVISGIGIVSPLGSNNESIWENIIQKRTGIRKSMPEDPWYNSGISLASPVDYIEDFAELRNRKNKRFMRRNVLFFIEALRRAVEDAGIEEIIPENHKDIAIITSCGDSGTDFRIFLRSIRISLSDEDNKINMKRYGARGLNLQDPYYLMYDLVNSANCFSAIEYDFNGESNNFIMSGGTGMHSIKSGYETIKSGRSKLAVVGASESLLNGVEMLYLYNKFGGCSKTDDVENAVVPYSDEKHGLVFGEGAAVLILEELNHATQRSAPVYGKLSSYATCVDLNEDLFTADKTGEGVERCIQKCLSMNNDKIDQNSMVVTAGMALSNEDKGELNALQSLFADEEGVSYTTFKPNFGYIGPVSDVLELSVGLLCMKKNVVLPVKNIGDKPLKQKLRFCKQEEKKEINTVLSITKGFGGLNSCLLANKLA